MKRVITLAMAILLTLSLFVGCGGSTVAPTATPPTATSTATPDLASMIKNGEIPSDVTELDLSYKHISDLTPLKDLPNLMSLYLKDNEISDLNHLKA
jgi:Leucine-rich repeat (LRR) protein